MLDDFASEDSRVARPERRRPRWGRRFVIVVASFLALTLVAAGGFVFFLNQKVAGNITQDDLLPQAAPSATLPDGSTVPLPQGGVGENYLIIGSDARPGETASRSDVIVLVHVPEDKSAVQLVHFPRDLYVSIPGRGKNKINAAYAFGGAPLLVSTMQNLLGVRIDHVAQTDFEGFRTMTDAVGGVRVFAEEASSGGGGPTDIPIKEGWNDLNGDQALAFVRERYELSEGDISRGRRQQAFIKALMLKALSREVITNPIKLTNFIDAATDNLVVDRGLDVGTMRSEAISLRNVRSGDVVFVTAPFTGFGTAPDGGSIEILDESGISALGKALRTDKMDDYADVSVTP
ncbi:MULTISPECIES: LCP family protein [unclassified Knoellia]|uniref:LCP family protein n=1 Tax=Knoellia altitudinis TaxID=3404795 RepID=UPI00360C02A7